MYAYNFNFISQFASLRFINSHSLLQYVHTQTHCSVRDYSNQDTYEKGMLKQNLQTFNFFIVVKLCCMSCVDANSSPVPNHGGLFTLYSLFSLFSMSLKELLSS